MLVHFTHHVNAVFPGAEGISYASQWKLVVCEYNNIRSRLYNNQAPLEGTNLMLYNINEGVLVITDVISMCEAYVTVFCIR